MNAYPSIRGAIAVAALLSGTAVLEACGAQHAIPQTPANPQVESDAAAPIGERAATTATTTASVSFTVRVPSAAAAAKSLSIAPSGTTATVANLSSTSPGCTAASATTPLTCMVHVNAPAGTDVFSIKTFSASNATGTQLAAATILQSVSATTGASVRLTLSGSIASLSLQLARSKVTECAPATTFAGYLQVRDASGSIVVGAYNAAVSLHDADTSGATKLSVTSVSNSATGVSVSYNGNKIGPGTTISASASGVATVGANLAFAQQLYVLDANNQYVQVFSPAATGNVAPARIINGRGKFTSQARQIAVSSACLLYVADGGSNAIFTFPAGGSGAIAPTATITGSNTLLNGPQGVGVDASGNIYAPVYNSTLKLGGVGVWPAGSSGNLAPARTIMGSNTHIGHPSFIAFDGSGNMYVMDFRQVVVFAKGATGNAAPLRVLLTPNLYCESGMTVDRSGNIYVTDCSNTVSVYAAGASGSAAPSRVINTGSSTGPTGAAIDYTGNIYTTLQRIPSVVSYASTASGTAATRTNIAGSNTTLNFPFNVAF